MPITDSQNRQRSVVLSALREATQDQVCQSIADKIDACSWNALCNSPYCPRCRNKKQCEKVKLAKTQFANAKAENLYFLTILLPATQNATDIDHEYLKIHKKRFRDHLNTKAVANPAYAAISYSGAFEIDVKHYSEATSLQATKTLEDLGFTPQQNAPAFLPHFHLLVHLPDISRDEFRNGLCAKLYPGFCQVRLQSLHSKKETEQSIEAITSYCFKFRVQKSDNIDTSYLHDDSEPTLRRTVYKEFYEPETIRDVVKQVHALNGFQGLTFKST